MAKAGEIIKSTQHDEHPSSAVEVDIDDAAELASSFGDHKTSLWTLSMIRLYGCLLIGYLCATVNGFDGAVMG